MRQILVVDDEESLREAIAFDLKRKGYLVQTAGNGRLAFDIVCKEAIDLVVTDVKMPGGDGIELLKRIKARDAARPAVILITGFADLGADDALKLGATAVFAKPFDRKAFLEAVARSLSGGQG